MGFIAAGGAKMARKHISDMRRRMGLACALVGDDYVMLNTWLILAPNSNYLMFQIQIIGVGKLYKT